MYDVATESSHRLLEIPFAGLIAVVVDVGAAVKGHCDIAKAVCARGVRELPGIPDCLESCEGRAGPSAPAAAKRSRVLS